MDLVRAVAGATMVVVLAVAAFVLAVCWMQTSPAELPGNPAHPYTPFTQPPKEVHDG